MLALDIATKTGYVYNLGNNLYIGSVEGTPNFQYKFLESIPHGNKIVIEDLIAFNSPNPRTLAILSMRFGYLKFRFHEENIDVLFYTPSQWRKYLNIKNSKAGTRELQKMFSELFKMKINLDETDALGLWLCANNLQLADLSSYNINLLGPHHAVS
jgi:Holliday junction resolvasome RuvABC endonuclease subunit